jgi:hypothetical protein
MAVVFALGTAGAASAQIVSACGDAPASVRRGGWVLDVSYHQTGPQSANNLKQIGIGFHYITQDGEARLAVPHGTAHIQDGTSNTILLAENIGRLACADADGDGRAGIAAADIFMRDLRTDDIIVLSIIAADGELDGDDEDVSIVIGNETIIGRARTRDPAH